MLFDFLPMARHYFIKIFSIVVDLSNDGAVVICGAAFTLMVLCFKTASEGHSPCYEHVNLFQ